MPLLSRFWIAFFFSLGLMAWLAEGLAAQDRPQSYVWLFDARGTEAESLAQTITEEFEEALGNAGCIPLVRRRNLPELQDHQQQELRIAGADFLSPRQRRLLSNATADAVVFGKITDDVQGGQIKIGVTLESLSGIILANTSVRIIRGRRFDAEERERQMQELAWDVCAKLGFPRSNKTVPGSDDGRHLVQSKDCPAQPDQFIYEDIKISFEKLRFNGDILEASFLLANEGSRERKLMLFGGGPVWGHDPSRVFGGGGEYLATGIVFGTVQHEWIAFNRLPPSVSLRAKVSFKGVPRSLQEITVLELNYNNGDGGYKDGSAVFRKVCVD